MMNTTAEGSPEALRARMVDRILASQSLTPAVETALRRVERHRFVPNAPVTDAYERKAVIPNVAGAGACPTRICRRPGAISGRSGHRLSAGCSAARQCWWQDRACPATHPLTTSLAFQYA